MLRELHRQFALLIVVAAVAACGDSGGAGADLDTAATSDSDADAAVGDATEDGPGPTTRYTVSPETLNGFGYETLTLTDADCAWPAGPLAVTVQGRAAVLVEVDGCDLRFDPQGGVGGDAPILVTAADGTEVATAPFAYQPAVDPDVFASAWCIGDSLGAAMVSWYLSYDAQVHDGMFAFFFRQASAACPHPLTRAEGVPFIVGLDAIDPATGDVPQEALITEEMLEFVLGQETGASLRLDPGGVACNQSVPGMHDVTWPSLPVIFAPGDLIGLYEELLRFPFGIPDDATPIMDVIEQGAPTFIIVSPGVIAYALDAVHVEPAQLDADLDSFLHRLADMPSAPVVLLATMPDTASLPGRPFTYAERYYNLSIDDALYRAVDRVNATLDAPRFTIAPTGELYIRWMAATESLDIGGISYPVEHDASGRVRVQVPGPDGAVEPLGLGRFQGFFSLDHVHLTATGHALVANVLIDALNGEFGPEGAHPRLSGAVPLVDIAPVVGRDVGLSSALEAQAAQLGMPALSTLLDPRPPTYSGAELCALAHGPLGGEPEAATCPTTLELVDGATGLPCAETAVTLPATLEVRVRGAGGETLAGAAVGLTALPAESHAHLTYLPGGLTDAEGQLALTIEAADLPAGLAGGVFQVQSGALRASCPLE